MARRIQIDRDDLELAFTMGSLETGSYLDVRTGKIELAANDLTGEDSGLSEEEVETGYAEGRLIRVEPLSSREEYRWMAEFADTVSDPRLAEVPALALNGKGAFRRFKDALHNAPAQRERWFHFHQECVNRAMAEWLERTISSRPICCRKKLTCLEKLRNC